MLAIRNFIQVYCFIVIIFAMLYQAGYLKITIKKRKYNRKIREYKLWNCI